MRRVRFPRRVSCERLVMDKAVWAGLLALCLVAVVIGPGAPWLATFPVRWTLPLADVLNTSIQPMLEAVQPMTRAFALALAVPLGLLRAGLQWMPWPSLAAVVVLLALRASGLGLGGFALMALLAIVGAGYWEQAMNTMAIVIMALPPSVGLGFALGVATQRWPALKPVVMAALDVMQTFPAFAYLIPLLILFGFGSAPGLIAAVIFSLPPMVRNTVVGLERVPEMVIEAALMCGATPRQVFWQACVPSAKAQFLVGVNQTTMAALSMVIIVAVIGGFDDIGWKVLAAMREAALGRSLLSGFVIVAMAILMDRITAGFAKVQPVRSLSANGFRAGTTVALLAGTALRLVLPDWDFLPQSLTHGLSKGIDASLMTFVTWSEPAFSALRDGLTYGLMLPLRIGLQGAASPAVWGFALQPWMIAAYALASATLALWTFRRSPSAAFAVIFMALVMFTGLPRFPWPGAVALALVLGWRSGGAGLVLLTAAAIGLILFAGLWAPFAQSAYLTGLAVLIAIALGGALGVLAAESDRLSAILRPINDALQTMPQFVFLIPALMLFRVGEFTALIAILLYAIVPPIRYVEHALRTVPPHLIEAATQMGATRWQLLVQVKLPLGRQVIRLGLNQTIMAALSMLVIAALVGTRDLGQQVYIALGMANLGLGIVAGLSISLVALVADRLLRD